MKSATGAARESMGKQDHVLSYSHFSRLSTPRTTRRQRCFISRKGRAAKEGLQRKVYCRGKVAWPGVNSFCTNKVVGIPIVSMHLCNEETCYILLYLVCSWRPTTAEVCSTWQMIPPLGPIAPWSGATVDGTTVATAQLVLVLCAGECR